MRMFYERSKMRGSGEFTMKMSSGWSFSQEGSIVLGVVYKEVSCLLMAFEYNKSVGHTLRAH